MVLFYRNGLAAPVVAPASQCKYMLFFYYFYFVLTNSSYIEISNTQHFGLPAVEADGRLLRDTVDRCDRLCANRLQSPFFDREAIGH